MKLSKFILVFALAVSAGNVCNAASEEPIVPRVKFTGDQFAQISTSVLTETLNDLLVKVEDGSSEKFPLGFMHTSTDANGVPNYYNAMWSRDAGRGVIELARFGFAEESKNVCRYFLQHMNCGDHWGREIHYIGNNNALKNELDGNAYILNAFYNTWIANGKSKDLAKEFCKGLSPVIAWAKKTIAESPYSGLMPSISELSGNPGTPYPVYGIYGNYNMYIALGNIAEMADWVGDTALGTDALECVAKLEKALERLISDEKRSYTPKGTWVNGIDSRDGSPYEMADWDHTSWPLWHWTRQLPFIADWDKSSSKISGKFADVHKLSYEHIKNWMCKGEYFRKYGFVSNTGWTGGGGRHDEYMCGYGQGFFTQATLMSDDVNAYSKALEGIARLGYDGNVVVHMNDDKNPFVMNECFNFDNYEKALDHTFGVHQEGRREIMENPGDEGNLVQEAEIIKAFSMVIGAYAQGNKLVIMPRLPWLWDSVECLDWPVVDAKGKVHRINFTYKHDRWLRRCSLEITGAEGFESIDVRFGPYAKVYKNTKNYDIEQIGNSTWIWKKNLKSNTKKIVIDL